MTSSYDILFSINLYHEYYLNRLCNDFDIEPTPDCIELAKRMNVLWRKKANGITVIIRENGLDEPFINIAPEKLFRQYFGKSVFRFYLKLKKPDFLNYTNTASSAGSHKKYYFSNLSKNEALFLTTQVPDYTNGKLYLPGNLVKDPTTATIYECLTKHTPKKKNVLHDEALWATKGLLPSAKAVDEFAIGTTYVPGERVRNPENQQVYEATRKHTSSDSAELESGGLWLAKGSGQHQYPTDNDLVEYSKSTYVCRLPAPVLKADISIFGFNFNESEPAYNVPVLQKSIAFDTPALQVPVGVESLQPGRYEIHVNKEVRNVYVDPAQNEANVFGIIEIFNHLPGSDPYAVVSDDEKIQHPRYQVYFANRRVLWKYIRKDGRADRITDTADNGYEFDLNGDDFVSKIPIPLTENLLKTLKLEFNTKDFRMFPLPNPPVNRLAKYTRDEYDYLCAEVLLNY